MVAQHRHLLVRLRCLGQHAPDHAAVRVHRLDEEHRTRRRAVDPGGERYRVPVDPVDRHVRRLRVEPAGGPEAVGLQVPDGQLDRGVDRQVAQRERCARFENVDRRRVARRFLARPDQVVALDRGEDPVADGAGRRVGRTGGNVDASGRPVGVTPAVVLAAQLGAVVGADGETDPAVQAAVLPHVDVAVVGSPYRQLPAQQLAMEHVARRHVGVRRHRMPACERICCHQDHPTGPEATRREPGPRPGTA